MERLQFREIAEVVNRIGAVEIASSPEDERQGLWALHSGRVLSGGLKFDCALLYIYADATRDGLESAKEVLRNLSVPNAQRQVVVAESKLQDAQALLEEFAPYCGSAMSTTQYLRACISQQLDIYVEGIKSLSHPHYVHPPIEAVSHPETASSAKRNALIESFVHPNRSGSTNSLIHVLIAEPGHGKTFFSKYLSAILLRFKFIPLFVESKQWSGLAVDDLSVLWKTVAHTFRALGAPIPKVEGYEESFIRICLKANLFRLVFDGFDEYVLKTIGHVDALEAMDSMHSMTSATGTPLLITSRSSFWESEVAPRLGGIADSVRVFQMKPFAKDQVARYLEQRFPEGSDLVDSGVRLFSELKRKTSSGDVDFVGRGFFLPLVADLVERDAAEVHVELRGVTATQWVMTNLCGREILAHRLPLTIEQQLNLFTEYAQLILAGEAPTLDTLRLVMEATAGLNRDDIDALTGKTSERSLRIHPLLSVDIASDQIVFASEQIFYSLLCEALLSGCRESINEANGSIRSMLTARNLAPSMLIELAESLVDHIAEISDQERFIATIRRVITSIKECEKHFATAHVSNGAAMISSIAMVAIAHLFRHKGNKRDKATALLDLLGVSGFADLDLMGTINGYDFRGASFVNCEFEGVTWFGCIFDSTTSFKRCTFRSNRVLACDGFGASEWIDCELDGLSSTAFRSEQIRAKRVPYTQYDLRHDLRLLCKKFIDAGRFRDVRERDLTKGPLGFSIHRAKIIDLFKRRLLDRHDASDIVSFSVTPSERASVQFFLDNGVPSGSIKTIADELSTSLRIPP